MKFKIDIKSRWSSEIKFSCEIETEADANEQVKLGMAVKKAYASGANLSGANLSRAYLRDADLRGANLSGAYLRDANLSGANLSRVYLRDADLRDADLSRAHLSGTHLSGAYLNRADLNRADLNRADLSGAYLSGAYLSGAYLSGACLSGADLSGACLSGACLSGADFRGACLSGACLSGADFRGADLSDILETVPLIPNIDAAILSAIEANKISGKNGLDMKSWHGNEYKANEAEWCETTHCRAGYAICLAGKVGFELERKYGPANTGMLLYLKSTPDALIPDWTASNDEAMADIRARAAKQTGAA